MRAVALWPNERRIRVVDHPEPVLRSASEVRLKMLEVGLCGTDRELAHGTHGRAPASCPYLVIGHESLGQVLEVGELVSRFAPGDLVVTTVRRPCPHACCRACRMFRQDFCFTGDFRERGIKEAHGFLCESVVDDERYMHPVPAPLREVGVLIEPLSIAEKALLQLEDVRSRLPWTAASAREPRGQRAVVLGAGPVGLLGAMALRVRGYETAVFSRVAQGSRKARWVESIGARYLSAKDVAAEDLHEELGRIDLMYEATGAAKTAFDALHSLGTNGVFVFTGIPGRKAPIELDAARLMRRIVSDNQLVFGSVNAGPHAFRAAVDDLLDLDRRWPGPLRALVSARHAPEETERLLREPHEAIKEVVSLA